MGLVAHIRSDILAAYGHLSLGVYLRSAFNPSILATALVRLATNAPGYSIWRLTLMFAFSCDVARTAKIGPGLRMPHPTGVVIGAGVRIGAGFTIFQNVTLGSHRGGYPSIGNKVTIYTSAVVVGPINIGDHSRIGALAFVSSDVATGEVVLR